MAPGGRETHTNNCARDVCQSPTTIGHSSLACLEPLAGLALTPTCFKQHDGQHQVRPMGCLAAASVGLGEQGHIEAFYRLSDLPSEVIVWELGIDLAPWCRLFIPRRLGEVDPCLGSMALVSDHVYGLLAGVQSDRVYALLCIK